MDEIALIEHYAHVIALFDLEEDQVSRENLISGDLIAGFVQLFSSDRNLQAGLFVNIVNQAAAVEGLRAFCPAAVRLAQVGHCVLDDVFPNLAVRFVEGDLFGAAGQEEGEGEK